MDDGDGGLVEFYHRALGHFDDHGVFFHVVNDAVDSGGGDHFVAGLESCDSSGLFLALTLTLKARRCNLPPTKNNGGDGLMKSLVLGMVALALASAPAWAQAGGEKGPELSLIHI